MLQGVTSASQKCQKTGTPKFLQGSYEERSNAMYGSPRFLQGAAFCPQKCHSGCAPASFIWCRDIIAAMLIPKRTKGRVNMIAQKCHIICALPTQFNGAIVKTQKCLDIVSPREGSSQGRSNANRATPFPPVSGGSSDRRRNAICCPPLRGSRKIRSNAIFMCAPASYMEPPPLRRNANCTPLRPNLGQ